MSNQTKCIDDRICPYCGHRFDGEKAMNYKMFEPIITCPKCEKEIDVSISVEYLCTTIED